MLHDRKELEDRVAEAAQLLKQTALSSFLMLLAAVSFLDGLAVVMPIAIGIVGVAIWRYRSAKRALLAFEKPPTARLLR